MTPLAPIIGTSAKIFTPMTQPARAPVAQTASQVYAKAQTDAANHLASIRALLARHAKIQSDETWNWEFVGDLGKINETLAEIRRQLR